MLSIKRALKGLLSQKVAKPRPLGKGWGAFVTAVAVGAAAIHLYSVYHGLFNPRAQRAMHPPGCRA